MRAPTKSQEKLVATTTSLEGSKKTNFRLIIYSQSFKFGGDRPVDVEIIGQKGIVKNKKQQQNTARRAC